MGLFSGTWGRLFLGVLGIAVLGAMQVRFSLLQSRFEERGRLVQELADKNAAQQKSMEMLVREQQKNEEKILAYERERNAIQAEFSKKRKRLQTADSAAQIWNKQYIPEEILAVLKQPRSR